MTCDMGMSPVMFLFPRVAEPRCSASAVAAVGAWMGWIWRSHLQFGVEPTDSNCYCRGVLGALWLEQENRWSGFDAPTAVSDEAYQLELLLQRCSGSAVAAGGAWMEWI